MNECSQRSILVIGKSVFSIAFGGLLFALCASAEAQGAIVPKIGFLFPGLGGRSTNIEGIQRELRALGYVEGKNITFEYRYARFDRLPALAEELVRLRVDVLVVGGPPAALAAKNATRTIPIVLQRVADPVAIGLIDSMAHPGGNITGLTIITEVLAGKRLELLKETIPKLSRVAMLWNPQNPGNALQWKETQVAAHDLGLQLYSIEVKRAERYESAFKEAIRARSTALTIAEDTLVTSNFKLIADLTIKNRLPAIYTRVEFVENGGLMSYGADQAEQDRRAAFYVDRILKGTKPADLPVEQPKKFDFVINLKTAKQIGLTIPPNVLARADRVIK
jgi:ABC-type uncharacterized transport system substrate-binding protein